MSERAERVKATIDETIADVERKIAGIGNGEGTPPSPEQVLLLLAELDRLREERERLKKAAIFALAVFYDCYGEDNPSEEQSFERAEQMLADALAGESHAFRQEDGSYRARRTLTDSEESGDE